MKTIKPILEGIYNNLELRRSIVPLFMGDPGVSKTSQIEAFAKEKGVNLVQFITSQRNPFEISGLGMPDKDIKRMSYWDFDTLLDMKDGDILFFDEVFNGNPTTLNACLTLLEGRTMISGKKLPNIMIVAAANPQGMVPLTPQIKERFTWYDVEFDSHMWADYVFDKYLMPKKISRKLCDLILGENFKCDKNFNSARSIDKAVSMIIKGVNTPYDTIVKPILNTIVKNPLKDEISLPDGRILKPEECIPWLELIRLNNKVEISDDDEASESDSGEYEIVVLDINDNIVGEIKNIETLKKMYYFTDDEISNINKGIKTLSPSRPLRSVFFAKKQY